MNLKIPIADTIFGKETNFGRHFNNRNSLTTANVPQKYDVPIFKLAQVVSFLLDFSGCVTFQEEAYTGDDNINVNVSGVSQWTRCNS